MEYQVVYAQGGEFYKVTEELEKKVNKLLKEGWALQGGVAQSITKYECILCLKRWLKCLLEMKYVNFN